VLKAVIPLFKSSDVDTQHYALSLTEIILHSKTDEVSCGLYCCARFYVTKLLGVE
jgi:hypothetical protein